MLSPKSPLTLSNAKAGCQGEATSKGDPIILQKSFKTKISDISTFGALSHDEDTIEALRSQHLGNDLMACWARRECKSMPSSSSGAQLLPAAVRNCAIQSLQYMLKVLELPADEWFTAATLFDRYCNGLPVDQCIRSLPCICCAIARLVKTNDDATCPVDSHDWPRSAAEMSAWLKKLGYANVEVPSLKDIIAEERSVINALDWMLSPPTISSWLLAFCTRLDVLTQREYSICLQWAWSQGFPCATHLVAVVSFAAVEPRTLTCGLLALLLVSAGLLELQDLRADSLGEDEWSSLFSQAQPLASGAPQCALEQGRRDNFMMKFCEAAGCDATSIKDHCHEAARSLKQGLQVVATHQAQAGRPTC